MKGHSLHHLPHSIPSFVHSTPLLLTVDQLEPLSHGVAQYGRQLGEVAYNHVVGEGERVQVGVHRDLFAVGREVRHLDVQHRVLVLRIVDDHVHDEDASPLGQLDRISHTLLALAEDIPAVAQHQQQVLKQIAVPAGRLLLPVRPHKVQQLRNAALVLVKVQALHQLRPIELLRVRQHDLGGLAKRHDTKRCGRWL